MTTIAELRQQQARIAAQARARFDEITDATPAERAAEIEREFDAMMAQHDQIGGRIERMSRLDNIEADLRRGDERRPQGADTRGQAQDPGRVVAYREAFYDMLRNGADMSREARSVLLGGSVSPEGRAQVVGTNSAGGFTVPTELTTILDVAMAQTGPMWDPTWITELRTSNGSTLNMTTINDTANSGVAHTEGGAVTDDGGADVVFGNKNVGAYAFDTEWVRFSYELAQDSIFNVEALLGQLLGERLGRTANAKLTTGSGSSDVEGVVTAASSGVVLASTSAITYDEIIDLEHSVDAAYRTGPKVGFMLSDATLKAVRKLKDGDGNYLWQAGNVQAGIPATINGYPFRVNQSMVTLGGTSRRIMAFGDFSKFYVRKVGDPAMFVARERFAPDLGILGLMRFDGVLLNTGAVKVAITAAS